MKNTHPRLTDSPFAKLDALRTTAGLVDDDVPEGAFTRETYEKHCKLSRTTAERELLRFVDSGAMKTGKKRTPVGGGRMMMVNFYWLVEAPDAKRP